MADLQLISAVVGEQWRPGIGDPTVVGWLTVIAYLVAAFGCGWAAFKERSPDGRRRERPATFWLVLAGAMVLLGINKQLDLQSLVTVAGRRVLHEVALYQDRRTYQIAFIGAVSATCLVSLALFAWSARRSLRHRWPALIGMTLILGFVVIRAASFHHVDALLASRLGGLKWNWIFELGGILVLGGAAFRVSLEKGSRTLGESKIVKIPIYYYKSK